MHLSHIGSQIFPVFEALPKNQYGRLSPRAVRYMLHGYFAKEHSWVIQGLAHHGYRRVVSEPQEIRIFQDKAPKLVQALLEAKKYGHGHTMGHVVSIVATLEQLVLAEAGAALIGVFKEHSDWDMIALDEASLHEAVRAYLLMLWKAPGSRGVATGAGTEIDAREQDMVLNFVFRHRHMTNPFTPRPYSFSAASSVVEALSREVETQHLAACQSKREDLAELDGQGTGYVSLRDFHGAGFAEPPSYLETIGALDDSRPGRPRVRIANYMEGPLNCMEANPYSSACCVGRCEALMSMFEDKLRAPSAEPHHILTAVKQLHASEAIPERRSAALEQRLLDLAERGGGVVTLHGLLFAQWLHYMFPRDCPFPNVVHNPAVLSLEHWRSLGLTAGDVGQSAWASRRLWHKKPAGGPQETTGLPEEEQEEEEELMPSWSNDEVFVVLDQQEKPVVGHGGFTSTVPQVFGLVLIMVFAACGSLWHARRGSKEKV